MPRSFIVIGLGNGDEGKGAFVDHLARRHGIRRVVRFNGGAQALHHVVTPDATHGFSQFGAGTFAGAQTLLSRFMLLEPLAFCREAYTLNSLGVADPFSLVSVSERAPVITPANILANQILEIHRGEGRHGSCGRGIGLTQGDVEQAGTEELVAGDLHNPRIVRAKLEWNRQKRLENTAAMNCEATRDLRAQLVNADLDDLTAFYGEFARRVQIVPDGTLLEIIAREDTIFEGAQGVLLDQQWGFFPYVTRSNTTFANALTLLAGANVSHSPVRIGLLRAYGTRHGAGPFPTETTELRLDPCHNSANEWQGAFRTGWFDAVLARYALDVVGSVDLLALTNLDRLIGLDNLKAAVAYPRSEHFPTGKISPVVLNKEAHRRRTNALLHVRPEYADLPLLHSTQPEELFRYADALAEHIGRKADILSACPDQRKIYRS